MYHEVEAAVSFLLEVLSLGACLELHQLEDLGRNLVGILCEKYQGHWYPDKPTRGQAFRCIRINSWQYIDESLLEACKRSGIEYSKLPLPGEMTLWIDPLEVSGRFEEDAEYFTIARFKRAMVTEQVLEDPKKETSDYSSDGTLSGTTSENPSDDEAPGDKATTSEDEAIEISSSSSGTPVAELIDSENDAGQTGSDVEEVAQETDNLASSVVNGSACINTTAFGCF